MIDSRRIPKAIAAGGYVEHVQQRQLPDVEGEQQQERTGARIPGSIDASRRLTPERAGGQGQKREDRTHRGGRLRRDIEISAAAETSPPEAYANIAIPAAHPRKVWKCMTRTLGTAW